MQRRQTIPAAAVPHWLDLPTSTTKPAVVSFRLVGALAFAVTPAEWHPLPHRGAALLLACVALQPTPRSRADLAALFWRGAGRPSARQAIYLLNEQVSAVVGRKVELLTGGDVLALAQGVEVDVAGGFAEAARRLELGELLPGIDRTRLPAAGGKWLGEQRQLWRGVRARAFADAAALLAARGDYQDAIDTLQGAFAVDAARLELAAQLAQLHSQVGSPEEGLAVVQQHRSALVTRGPVAIKGAGRSEQALADLERRLVQERDAPRAGIQALPAHSDRHVFPGREDLLVDLQRHWEAGHAFLLIGEAGIGKSYLLQRLQERKAGAVLVRAELGDADIPYETARRWLREVARCHGIDAQSNFDLRRLLPELGSPPLGPTTDGALLRAQVQALAQARERGLTALLVDDLQFADPASVSALHRCIDAHPSLAFGLATRPNDEAAQTQVQGSAASGSARVRPVPIPRLSLAEARHFVGRLDPQLQLDGRSLEMLLLFAGVPWHFIDLVQRCLERGQSGLTLAHLTALPARVDLLLPRLTEQQRALLNLVAFTGPDFTPPLAMKVLALPKEEVEEAMRVLKEVGAVQGTVMAHDILRGQVLERLDKASLRGLFAVVADSLSDSAPAERHAHYCAGAERFAQAARHACVAARRADLLGARSSQHQWLANAEAWFRRAAMAHEAFRAGVESIEPCLYRHGTEAALGEAERLAALATSVAERASVDVQRGRIEITRYEFEAALGWARAADVAGASDETRALAAGVVTLAHAFQGRIDDAMSTIQPLMRSLEWEGNDRLRWEIWSAYGIALSQDERWQQIATLWPAVVEDAHRVKDEAWELDAMNSLASAYSGLGRAELAIDMHRAVTSRRSGMDDNPESQRVSQLNLAVLLVAIGHYAEALETLQALLAMADSAAADSTAYRFAVQDVLGETWLALGRPDLARELLAGETSQAHAGRRLSRALLRARAASDAGTDDACELWREALAVAEQPTVSTVRRERARLTAIGFGLPMDDALCRPALALASERDHAVLELQALVRLAQCDLHNAREVEALMRERLQTLARSTQTIYLHRPEVLLTVGDTLLAAGQSAKAQIWLKQARQWVLQVAGEHVPREYRGSFLDRPIHRRLLADDAGRRRGARSN